MFTRKIVVASGQFSRGGAPQRVNLAERHRLVPGAVAADSFHARETQRQADLVGVADDHLRGFHLPDELDK